MYHNNDVIQRWDDLKVASVESDKMGRIYPKQSKRWVRNERVRANPSDTLNSGKRGCKKDSLRGKLPKEEEASWPGETDHRKRPKYCCAWRGLLTKNFLRSLKCQSVCSIHDHRRLSHKTFIYFHYSTFLLSCFILPKVLDNLATCFIRMGREKALKAGDWTSHKVCLRTEGRQWGERYNLRWSSI